MLRKIIDENAWYVIHLVTFGNRKDESASAHYELIERQYLKCCGIFENVAQAQHKMQQLTERKLKEQQLCNGTS